MPNRPSKSIEVHNYKTSVPIVQPAHIKRLALQNKVYNKSILTYPIKNYKLNDDTKQAIIPKSHLQQLNIIKPNFDWSGALYHAGKHFIPHFDTIHDVVKGIHHGYKWIKNYIGGDDKHKHKMKENAKMDVVRHVTDKVKTFKPEIKPQIFNKILPQSLVKHNVVEIVKPQLSLSHPSDRPKDIVQSANQTNLINKNHKMMEKDFEPFIANNILLDISTGTYVAGQILAVIPLTTILFDNESFKDSQQFTYLAYSKIFWEYLSYFSENSGGGFMAVFDPDPKSQWVIGSNGLANLQRARMMSGAKQFNVYGTPTKSEKTGNCPLEYLKDLYYVNPANGTDSRNNMPGSLIIMATSGFTISAGSEGQFMLLSKGTFQLRDDSWGSSTYESNIYSPSNVVLLNDTLFHGFYVPGTANLNTGLDLLVPCFFGLGGNSTASDAKIFTSTKIAPLTSTNPYISNGTANNNVSNYGAGLPPGVWRIKQRVLVNQITFGTVAAQFFLTVTTNGGATILNQTTTTLDLSSTASLPAQAQSILNYDGSVMSTSGRWLIIDCLVSVPYNPTGLGYFMNPIDPTSSLGTGVPTSAVVVPTSCGFARISMECTTGSANIGTWGLFWMEASINRLYGPISVTSYSVSSQINADLYKSMILAHKEAEKLSCHDEKHCPVCEAKNSLELEEIKDAFSPRRNSEEVENLSLKEDESEYKIAILLDLIMKNKAKLTQPDQDLLNKLRPQLLSTTKNDSVDSYKLKPLII